MIAAVDVGGPAWLVSTTSRVASKVGPHSAVTVCWPIATDAVIGVEKLPLSLATVLPTNAESMDSWTGLLGVQPWPVAVRSPPGGTASRLRTNTRSGVATGGVVAGTETGGVVVGGAVVGGVVAGTLVAGGLVGGGLVVTGLPGGLVVGGVVGGVVTAVVGGTVVTVVGVVLWVTGLVVEVVVVVGQGPSQNVVEVVHTPKMHLVVGVPQKAAGTA
jgi:hypothetical protein